MRRAAARKKRAERLRGVEAASSWDYIALGIVDSKIRLGYACDIQLILRWRKPVMNKPSGFKKKEATTMEYFRSCDLNDIEELQRISQTAYIEAFCGLLSSDDVKEYVKSKYSHDNLKKEFKEPSNHFLFFYIDDNAVGYMKYTLKTDSLEIDRLYMLQSFKGMGAGSKFMGKAEELARLNGKKALTLGVLALNKLAISFYEKKGFQQYSNDTVRIGQNNYQLLLMKRELE